MMVVLKILVLCKDFAFTVDIHVVNKLKQWEVNKCQVVTHGKHLLRPQKLRELQTDILDTLLKTVLVAFFAMFA